MTQEDQEETTPPAQARKKDATVVDRRLDNKRVWRVYQEAGLAVKRTKRRRLTRVGRPLEQVTEANQE